LAKSKGVEISLIGIEGEDCGVTVLGNMAQITGGEVTIVKPLELQRKMRAIIDNPVIATDVKIRIFLHPYMSVMSYGKEVGAELNIDIGNVTAETDLGLQFTLSEKGIAARESGELDKIKQIPFQVQALYRKLDSTKCLRILSEYQNITQDRDISEKDGDVAVISLTTIQTAVTHALTHKEYKEARQCLFSTQHLLDRLAQTDEQQEEYDIYAKQSQDLDIELRILAEHPNAKVSDKAAKVLYELRATPMIKFLAGSRKDVSKRKKHVGELKQLKI